MNELAKYIPSVVLMLWTLLVLNHMSRDLNWMPLLAMYIPLLLWVIVGGLEDE